MPINPDAVGARSEPSRRSWTSNDSLLYAVGVGAGAEDPLAELEFTTENSQDVTQRALPTMPVVLGFGGGDVISILDTGTFQNLKDILVPFGPNETPARFECAALVTLPTCQ